MTRKELYRKVSAYFKEAMPEAKTELHYDNPFQLLVAVILSAQCTDKRINQVTPKLFEDYPNAEAMALATPEVIYDYIKSVSYPNNKAKHLVEMARMLWEKYGGEVPQDLKQLTELPGVGRKTANVVLNVIFHEPTMPVDTHLLRVAPKIGLAEGNTPETVEKSLLERIPAEFLHDAHHWILLHGRYVCTARNPKCGECIISDLCKHNS